MLIRVADLTVELHTPLEQYASFCSGYRVTEGTADFSVSVSEQERKREQDLLSVPLSPAGAENNALCRKISDQIVFYDGFLLHAAVVEVDGFGYAFAAPSGTGKSTHVNYWLQRFAGRARVINGDKPFVRRVGVAFYAYGSPWCGKEGLQVNAKTPLKGLAFLERSSENHIASLSTGDAVLRLFRQVLLPQDRNGMIALTATLDQFVQQIPVYRLGCNLSPDAARVAYEGMR